MPVYYASPVQKSGEVPHATHSDGESGAFLVIENAEHQYCRRLACRTMSESGVSVGPSGARRQCLDRIDAKWTSPYALPIDHDPDPATRYEYRD
jgi:uncharacterized protein YbdZ (MbtH family)